MKKYLLVFKLAVQSILQYRFNVLLYMLFGILPLVAILYLWIEIFRNKESINGFTLEMMITYVILAKVLEMALIPQIQWTIHDDVRTGEISKYIYKPVDYLLYWFSHNLGYKVTYLVASLIPLSIIAILLKAYIIPPKVENLLIFILSIIGSLLLYFLIYYLIALVSFWLIDISAFFFTANIVLELLSGTLIPLNFLPEYLQKTLEFLPFSYLIYFPLNIYLGRISNNDVYMGLATQIIWIVFFGIIARLTWKKGLRKYEAIGS